MGNDDPSLGSNGNQKVSIILIVIASTAFVVTIYHCVMIGWCRRRSSPAPNRLQTLDAVVEMPSLECSATQLIPAHKYQKEAVGVGDDTCAICLCEFEEGEELRRLPECVHSFHAPCIDMWLYSHASCPMCRMDTTPSPQITFPARSYSNDVSEEAGDQEMSDEMKSLSRVGVGLSVIFGCLLLALLAELYYLLCWKKKRIAIPGAVTTGSSIERGRACSDFDTVPKSSRNNFLNLQRQEDGGNHDTDKEFLFKTVAEGPGAELFKFPGPPRFLFTIVEETKEDLESDDGKGGARVKRSLSDFLAAVECQTPFLTPVASPSPPVTPYGTHNLNGGFGFGSGFDPSTFDSGRDAEFNRMRCSPPPKFKFLQDAEEKLRKKLMEVEVVRRVNVDQHTLPSPSSLKLASADERVISINI